MNKSILAICLVLALLSVTQAKWDHQFSPADSAELGSAIKGVLLSNIKRFANTTFAGLLQKDLNQADDSKRGLKEIDQASVSQIFSLFKLSSSSCKFDTDGFLRGDGLKCLNNIWKNYVPSD